MWYRARPLVELTALRRFNGPTSKGREGGRRGGKGNGGGEGR